MAEARRIDDVVIHSAERTTNSTNGNPGYRFHTSAGVYPMQVDAALGYAVENFTNSRFPETFVIGNPAEPRVTLVATGSGRVWGIEYQGRLLT